jgi:hypothetical protein
MHLARARGDWSRGLGAYETEQGLRGTFSFQVESSTGFWKSARLYHMGPQNIGFETGFGWI